MQKIEDVESPVIGAFYLVRCIKTRRGGGKKYWFPVIDEPHRDGKHGLDEPHYHTDWRFVPENLLMEQRNFFNGVYDREGNSEYITGITTNDVLEEKWLELEYLRDHNYPTDGFFGNFASLKEAMKDVVMKNMICPHHRTKLTSCKPVDGIVTCPQHGLKWDVKTGKQVI